MNLDCDIYQEPNEFLKLSSMEEDFERLKSMKPFEIYISYCNKFSRQNLEKNALNFITLYQFKQEDFNDSVLPLDMDISCRDLLDYPIREETLEEQTTFREFEGLELRDQTEGKVEFPKEYSTNQPKKGNRGLTEIQVLKGVNIKQSL